MASALSVVQAIRATPLVGTPSRERQILCVCEFPARSASRHKEMRGIGL